jgi:hypothetical protein
MTQEPENKAVYLPAELYNRIKERAEASSFESVEEYVILVLSEVLSEEESGEADVDRAQEAEIKKRLKSLGYLE